MGIWSQVKEYLFLKRKDPDAPRGINFRLMHGMNRISIFIFLAVMIVLLVRLVRHLLH